MLMVARSSQDFALRLLFARNRERTLEMRFGFCRIRFGQHQHDFAVDE